MRPRNQDPLASVEDVARFESFVVPEPNTGCWLWVGAYDIGGYGRFWSGQKTMKAHRASWRLFRGPIPDRMILLHSCVGMRACVNPGHLRVGTHLENAADTRRQGRSATGAKNARHVHPETTPRGERNGGGGKLTTEDVLAIRASPNTSSRILAAQYGVSRGMVRAIVRRVVWRHV